MKTNNLSLAAHPIQSSPKKNHTQINTVKADSFFSSEKLQPTLSPSFSNVAPRVNQTGALNLKHAPDSIPSDETIVSDQTNKTPKQSNLTPKSIPKVIQFEKKITPFKNKTLSKRPLKAETKTNEKSSVKALISRNLKKIAALNVLANKMKSDLLMIERLQLAIPLQQYEKQSVALKKHQYNVCINKLNEIKAQTMGYLSSDSKAALVDESSSLLNSPIS